MEPVKFKESTRELQRPADMSANECKPLPIFTNGEVCISKWKMSWRERLRCLASGHLWLSVRSGSTQPPVALYAKRTIFPEEEAANAEAGA